MTLDPALITKAAATIAGTVAVTPTVPAAVLSGRLGCQIWLKLETLHRTGSFKERGALNKLLSLTAEQRRRGVIAMSAGNHAQGVAYHAGRLGIPSTIVMPSFTPFTKVARTEAYGARVVLEGESLSDAAAHAEKHVADRGLTLIHPYDDLAVIAGQGTIGAELLAAAPDLETVVVPMGGGGLIAGIATAIKAANPAIQIIGVQASLYPAMQDALRRQKREYAGATIADGIAVKHPGKLTRQIIADLVDDIVLVDEAMLERAVQCLVTMQRVVAEGAGAAALAALLSAPERFAGRRVGVIVSGGNIDGRLLASVLMRGLVRDGQLVRLRIEIDDSPGTLSKVAGIIGRCGGNIVEVYHQRLLFDVPVKRADLDIVIETRDRAHVQALVDDLGRGGFPATVLNPSGS